MADQNSTQTRQDAAERRRNPADNLTRDARIRGGERSARMQQRDARGQFAGRRKEGSNIARESGAGGGTSAGRHAGEPGDNR